MAALKIPVSTARLGNGLQVVVSPERTAPVATVGVYYRIGFRLEPEGRSGFAHLFEHMMFQGSAHAGKMMHIRLVNASGGLLNGSTAYDYTNYYEVVPSNALDRVLWLEADRMAALQVNEENLRNQRDVVKEEVRVNVLNQPYGGFPWLDMPPVAYRRWPNAHNFYGDFEDLDAASLDDVREFFRTYYTPRNAVLVVVGDVDSAEVLAMAERHFGRIPSGPLPPLASADEDPPSQERRGVVEEKFGSLRGLAVGYYAPKRRTEDWYAFALADRVLHGGRAGRVYRELVLEKQAAVDAEGALHFPSGDLFDYDGPMLMTTRILHRPETTPEETLAAYDQVIELLRSHGPEADEMEQVKAKLKSDYYSMLEGGSYLPWFGRMHYLACFTLFDGDAGLVNTILDDFADISPARVRDAAEHYLSPASRAIVERRPVNRGGQ
ncbi:MAG TPA: pitrilysin family protein [Candidatus Dormibacteraeota bacterium]|nr:pitrilysin family protein [Candidatus Dormibacteraeota bacterium]